ncbi:hypothetical protein GCM10010329_26300 [Streptomyces spiroverticillatus]|uniref:Uncharacterized protein n=1 Tax=Streptomyces finlayi TaxID=67296 RepID=A0A918WVF4_9ACTN|nr:hypothetical protein [Streptomyces finlayi]GHA02914.1 hypothetical protein GCM10010329_26300 [Streptomyces spiroverticillatus]GHC87143.1 hypothetical protein GCM10010334_18710 [Streptomyces finlayi]
MLITEDVLRRAWRELADRCELLDTSMLPRTTTDPGYYRAHEGAMEGLLLVVGDDGTVCGQDGPYSEAFATDDLDEVLYFAAEEAVRGLVDPDAAAPVSAQAELLDRIDPAWGRRFRGGGTDDAQPPGPCGKDPLEGFAWIVGSWREQDPYTHLSFFRGDDFSAEQLVVSLGADPGQVAAGTTLAELRAKDDSWGFDQEWGSCCYGRVGEWVFVLHHERPYDVPEGEPLAVTETVDLCATSAKAVYSFTYARDDRVVGDDMGLIELLHYNRGRTPYRPDGELDFLNRAVRRAELDHPELDEYQTYFHALETSLGLSLPRRAIEEGTVLAAQWARR